MVVGIAGYYGYKNAGDEAILSAIIQELRRRRLTPLVLSANPGLTRAAFKAQTTHRLNPFGLLVAFRRMDTLLLGGGGLLQDRTSRRSLWYYLQIFSWARRLGAKPIVFNQSLGPLSPEGERAVARTIGEHMIIVRDRRSLEYAQSLGLRARLGADPALLLPPPPVGREPGLVVVVPRYGVPTKPLVVASYRLLKLGYDVLVLAMQPGADEETFEAFTGLPKEASGDPRRVHYLLASASYVVSARLHGLILAANAGTPYLGINYDPKVLGFLEETKAPVLPTNPDPGEIVDFITADATPDWQAVAQLKARARQSFDWVFQPSPTPANGP